VVLQALTAADRPMVVEPPSVVRPARVVPVGDVADMKSQAQILEEAAEKGVSFCEECEKTRAL